MTKKFWNSWQNRIGETKNIYLSNCIYNQINARWYYCNVLSTLDEDKILKASFHEDTVDLIIERHMFINGHYHVENEYLTLHRQDIRTIKFWKY